MPLTFAQPSKSTREDSQSDVSSEDNLSAMTLDHPHVPPSRARGRRSLEAWAASPSSADLQQTDILVHSPTMVKLVAHDTRSSDDVLELSSHLPLCAELPDFWELIRQHLLWLAFPFLLIGIVIIGVFFLEDQRPAAGSLVLLAAVYMVCMGYLYGLFVWHKYNFLLEAGENLELIDQCDSRHIQGMLSENSSIRYLQLMVCTRSNANPFGVSPPGEPENVADHHDPLHFLSLDIATRADSTDGHVITDKAGTILWCNNALSDYFKYPHHVLVSENIRILIPPPYNALHDSLMRKYNRNSTVKLIVGCTRPVPVIDKDGTITSLDLSVEERIDPADETHYVFLGRLAFTKIPDLVSTIQERVSDGTSVVLACQDLDKRPENFLIINSVGIILFANCGIPTLLGWSLEDLIGNNVAMLMNAEVGQHHDAYLARYMEKAKSHLAQGEGWPNSGIVGHGRDLYARCKDGYYIRTWLTVHRIDAPSARPQDCYFLGTIIYVQGQEGGMKRRQRLKSQSVTPSAILSAHLSAGKSATGISHATNKSWGMVMSRKKCTVVLFDIHGLRGCSDVVVARVYETFLIALTTACQKHNGHPQSPIGDRVMVTFNFMSPNTSQRSAAGYVMEHVLSECSPRNLPAGVRVCAAASTGDALCGTFGRHSLSQSEMLDSCSCMLSIADETGTMHGLINGSLYDELQYAYECRLLNIVTIDPKTSSARKMPVYELSSAKILDEDEWMYQIEANHKEDPLAAWKACWIQLQGRISLQVPSPAKVDRPFVSALEWLTKHIALYPMDPVALWLQKALQQQQHLQRRQSRIPPLIEWHGKTQYQIHYHSGLLHEEPDTPNTWRRSSRGTRRTGSQQNSTPFSDTVKPEHPHPSSEISHRSSQGLSL